MFIETAKSIVSSSFIKNIKKSKNLRHTIKFSNTGGTVEKVEGVNEDLLKSFLLDFRKIYMQGEDTNFYTIYGILFRNAPDQKTKDNLVKCRTKYSEILNKPLMVRIFINGDLEKPINMIDDWFYGLYFHEVKDKKEKLLSLNFIKLFHKFNMVSAVIDLTYIIHVLSNNAKNILQNKSI